MTKVLIRGAGDLATGIAWRLYRCGFQILMTETARPTMVRRTVAFSNAVYEGSMEVEGVTARLVSDESQADQAFAKGEIPIVIDEDAAAKTWYRPEILVDAIIAKKNLGTRIDDASLVIGVGPGFTAGEDCHLVVETKRGHTLGRVIESGSAIPNTGVPGSVGGFTIERLIKANAPGTFTPHVSIGDFVKNGQVVAESGGVPILAQMDGLVRGMLYPGLTVTTGMKCGDIDARCEKENCFTISDKALSIGGGVLEGILYFQQKQ